MISGDYESREALKEWIGRTNKIKQKAGLPIDYSGWTSRPDVKLTGVPDGRRYRDALDTLWGIKVNAAATGGRIPQSQDVRRGLWINLSQNVDRIGKSGSPGSLCTSGLWYSYEFDFALDGSDMLALQGFPQYLVHDPNLSSHEKRNLAGEAFNLPCFGLVMFALYLNPWAPWWKGPAGAAVER